MAKFAPDDTLDASLDLIAGSDEMHACSAQPSTFGDVATFSLGSYAMDSGDFAIADAGGGGRQLTVAGQTGGNADGTGAATHVALVDTTSSALRLVTTCPSEDLTDTEPFEVGSWVVTAPDPT